MSAISDKIYVAPDGKRYQQVGISEDQLPQFNVPASGDLDYRFLSSQDEFDMQVDSNDDLQADGLQLTINDDGTINTDVSWQLMAETSGDTDREKKDIQLLRSHNKLVKMRVTLFDEHFIKIQSFTGIVKGYPSYDIDADSDIRRTCNITLAVIDKERLEIDFENTWNNRMVKLECGLYDWEGSEYVDETGYVWYNLGIMLVANGESEIASTVQEIRLNLVDLMAAMTEERGSQIGETYLYQAGDDPQQLIEKVVEENTIFTHGMTVCEFDEDYPYDQESNQGDYAVDVLRMIFDLFPYYEFFYDVNGAFTVRKIPTYIGDGYPIQIPKEVLDELIISERKTVDFSQIKNTTEIWGHSLTADYITGDCLSSNSIYNVSIDETFTTLESGATFTVVPDVDSVSGQKLKIQNTDACFIKTVNGAETTYTNIPAGAMKAGVGYVVRYFEHNIEVEEGQEPTVEAMFILMGEFQIRVIVQEITEMPSVAAQAAYKEFHSCNNVQWIVNPDSTFACTINSTTGQIEGEKRQVLLDGEYDNIYTTQLAYERASYENWLCCRKQDTVEIESILIPWIDVNQKIEYTSPMSGEVGIWLVKAVSFDFKTWTMTVTADRFYPYYPFVQTTQTTQEETQGGE